MVGHKAKAFQQHARISLEDLVPPDNFYRQLEAELDLTFVRSLVEDCYASRLGRPSIDPVVFFKLQLIMFFEGFRSERQLMEQVNLNLAFRWYIGYDLDEPVPDHSSLSRIRDRYGVDVFQRFFEKIVERCVEAGLVWGKELYFDGTMVRANAAFQRQVPRFYQQAHAHLQQRVADAEPPMDRGFVPKYDGTRPVVRTNAYKRQTDYWVSPVDPSASPVGHQRLGYHLYYAIDGGSARIILNCLVTPSTVQDNTPMLDLAWWTRFRWQLPLATVVADRRYGTIENVVSLEQNGVRAFIPLHAEAARTRSQNQLFPASRFRYDAQRDGYLCPQNKFLRLHHIDHDGQRANYKADVKDCGPCPVRAHCTTSQQGRRISHSLFKPLLDQVQAYQQTTAYRKAMRKRQVWVEPKFAELKQWHNGVQFRLRGLWKVNVEALIKASGQNLKQLLKTRNRLKGAAPTRASRRSHFSTPWLPILVVFVSELFSSGDFFNTLERL